MEIHWASFALGVIATLAGGIIVALVVAVFGGSDLSE